MDDINFFIDKINYVYRNRMLIKCFVIVISLVTILMSLYLFILPAFTLNSENSYVLNLIDSYDYSWKEGLTTSYNLDLYFYQDFQTPHLHLLVVLRYLVLQSFYISPIYIYFVYFIFFIF